MSSSWAALLGVWLLAGGACLHGAVAPAFPRPQLLVPWIDDVSTTVAADLRTQPPTLARAQIQLTVGIWLPEHLTLLASRTLALWPVSSGAERLAVWAAPAQRLQRFTLQDAPNRDRELRLPLECCPPEASADHLDHLAGDWELLLGDQPITTELGAGLGATASTRDGACTVADRGSSSLQLDLPRPFAERLTAITAIDLAGDDVPIRHDPLPAPAPEGAPAAATARVTLLLRGDLARVARLRLTAATVLTRQRVHLRIRTLAIPGGIPGTGSLGGAGLPWRAPVRPQVREPLAQAVEARDLAAVERLLPRLATAVAEADGHSPLERACALDAAAIARRLLAAGADVNAHEGGDGWSPLHAAIAANDAALVQALLDAGADPAAMANDGRSCLDLARTLGRWQLVRLLGPRLDAHHPPEDRP